MMTKPAAISVSVPYLQTDRLNDLKALFPEAFSEGRLDFEKLRLAPGDPAAGEGNGRERYSFTWAGKRDCIRLLQAPTRIHTDQADLYPEAAGLATIPNRLDLSKAEGKWR